MSTPMGNHISMEIAVDYQLQSKGAPNIDDYIFNPPLYMNTFNVAYSCSFQFHQLDRVT